MFLSSRVIECCPTTLFHSRDSLVPRFYPSSLFCWCPTHSPPSLPLLDWISLGRSSNQSRIDTKTHFQIFRAVHHLLLTTINNPFISLPPTFRAKRALNENTSPQHTNSPDPPDSTAQEGQEGVEQSIRNPVSSHDDMFKTDPNDISPLCLQSSVRFETGMKRIGEYLSGGRA